MARTGTSSGNTSGDIILAFSTGNAIPMNGLARVMDARLLSTDYVDPLFRATVEATEEAVVNALMKGETMTGINGNTVYALPDDRLRQVMAEGTAARQVSGSVTETIRNAEISAHLATTAPVSIVSVTEPVTGRAG